MSGHYFIRFADLMWNENEGRRVPDAFLCRRRCRGFRSYLQYVLRTAAVVVTTVVEEVKFLTLIYN